MSGAPGALRAETISRRLRTRYVGQRLLYFPSVSSTMDAAGEEARRGAPEGTTVVADHQTAGRGRFRRPWVSPANTSIHVSVVLRPPVDRLLQLGQVASLAVAGAVRRETGLTPGIKWPNDVVVNDRKLAGILIDGAMKGGGVDYAVVGTGLNVSLDPSKHPEIAAIATSLARELGRSVDRLPVLTALLEETEALYERVKRGESLVAEWRRHLTTLGRRVTVTWPGDSSAKTNAEEGLAEDVDEDGALLLRRDDGSAVRLIAGEVTLRDQR